MLSEQIHAVYVPSSPALSVCPEDGTRAEALHDKAPETFRPTTVDERHALFYRLRAAFPQATPPDAAAAPAPRVPRRRERAGSGASAAAAGAAVTVSGGGDAAPEVTLFTVKAGGVAALRPDRPAILIRCVGGCLCG
jgi:hypothetical protein